MSGGLGSLVNLGMIGGLLHQRTPQIISEHMPVAKMLDGGSGLGSVMQQMVSGGGLQSVLPNPVGALGSQLQSTIAQGVSQLSGIPGVSSLVTSLTGPGGLSGAVTSLMSSGSGLLSGEGLLSVASHSNIAGMLGSALPSGMGLDAVLAPVRSAVPLDAAVGMVPSVVSGVLGGTLSVVDAVAQVQGHTDELVGIVTGSQFALDGVRDLMADTSALSTAAWALVGGPPELREVLEDALPQDIRDVMVASVNSIIDE